MNLIDVSLNTFERISITFNFIPFLTVMVALLILTILLITLSIYVSKITKKEEVITVPVTIILITSFIIALISGLYVIPDNINNKVKDSFISYLDEQPSTEINVPHKSLKRVDNVDYYIWGLNYNYISDEENIIYLEVISPLPIKEIDNESKANDIIQSELNCTLDVDTISLSGKILKEDIHLLNKKSVIFHKGFYNSTLNVPYDHALCDNHIS